MLFRSLVRTLVRTDLDASVRIWLVAVQSGYPATDPLVDLTLDVRSGPRNSIGLRTARIPGRTDLNVGVPAVWNESSTWNPVGSGGDIFSTNLLRLVTDPGILYDPWSGLATPYRTSYEVRTAGPDGTHRTHRRIVRRRRRHQIRCPRRTFWPRNGRGMPGDPALHTGAARDRSRANRNSGTISWAR